MTAVRAALLAAVLLTSAACGALSAQERPAVIASPTERSRAELERIVASAFDRQPVLLAQDALTRDSVLTIERRTPAGPQGRIATGRTLEMPQQFKLVLRGSRCMLIREGDGREWELTDAQCVPHAP